VYVCVCMCMYVYVCVCMCMYVYVCVCMCMYVYVCIYMRMCIYVYVYVCVYVCVYMCVCMCILLCVYIIYVCVFCVRLDHEMNPPTLLRLILVESAKKLQFFETNSCIGKYFKHVTLRAHILKLGDIQRSILVRSPKNRPKVLGVCTVTGSYMREQKGDIEYGVL